MGLAGIAAVALCSPGQAWACSCAPMPAPLDAQMDVQTRAFVLNQWRIRLATAPHVFSAVVSGLAARSPGAATTHQALRVGEVQMLWGKAPAQSTLHNSLLNCPAQLVQGQRYLFFAGPDYVVGHCGVVPYSVQARERVQAAVQALQHAPGPDAD